MQRARHRLPSPRALAIGAAVLLALAAPFWIARTQRVAAERVAEPIAAKLTNRSIDVRCPGLLGKLMFETNRGSVRFDQHGVPEDITRLDKHTCAGLRTVGARAHSLDFTCLQVACDADTQRAAEAIVVLTHEIMHLRGTTDEGVTECQARRHIQAVAIDMGIAPPSASALAAWQAGPWQARLPDRYRNASC